MARNVQQEAHQILDRLQVRYGYDRDLRARMLPVLVRVLDARPATRRELLRLVIEAYEHHVKVRRTLGVLRSRLRDRLNEVYGQVLGIEPPRVG